MLTDLRLLVLVPSVLLLLTQAGPPAAQTPAGVIAITGAKPVPARRVDTARTDSAAAALVDISGGGSHTCGLTNAGGAKCWGYNAYGQLGDGTTTHRSTPVDVKGGISGAAAIAAGQFHTCAVTNAGGVKCWGRNWFGALGDGTTKNRSTAVDVVGLTSGVTTIATGGVHSCALTDAGGVKCWGWNADGQLGDGTQANRSQPVDVVGLTRPVVAITVGDAHTCALTDHGGVKCWGRNDLGSVGDGSTCRRYSGCRRAPVNVVGLTSGVVAITAGYVHNCALLVSYSVMCWGWNRDGQLGDGTTTDRLTPVFARGHTTAIATGYQHTCAIADSGRVKCWGSNGSGQLGDGTTTSRYSPVRVFKLRTRAAPVIALSGGGFHTCALTDTGGAKCWGNNEHGRLGDGTTKERHTPVDVVGF